MTLQSVRGVLFDLDGTLIDSAADLHASVNKVLASNGRTQLALPDVVAMIGHGMKKLVERAFAATGQPLNAEKLDIAYGHMLAIYSQHLTDFTTLSAGVAECIDALSRAGIPMAVVTNKPRAATIGILDHFGLTTSMAAIIGGDSGLPRKPAPDMLLWAAKEMGLEAANVVMVGDSQADIDSARAAAIPSIAVKGGYTQTPVDRLGADAVIDGLDELPGLIGLRSVRA